MDIVSTGLVIQSEEDKSKAHRLERTVDDLQDVDPKWYSGLMIISGNPKDTENYYTHHTVVHLVTELHKLKRPLAGICAAVPALAPAVKGRKVSWFPLQKSRNILVSAGAILTEVGLSVDGHLITAENEWVTGLWAAAFRDMVLNKEPYIPKLTPSGLHPKHIPRKDIPELERLKSKK